MLYLFCLRAINGIKIVAGFILSLLLKKPFKIGLPLTVSVEPVNYCNLHCVECPTGNGSTSRRKELMQSDLFYNIIDQIKVHASYLTLYFQGEPFIHPEFDNFIKLARKNHIYTATSTNGQLINKVIAEKTVRSGLNKLIVSIDGTTQDTYEKYRVGGKLEKAVDAIKLITECKNKLHSNSPKIEMQFLVLRHNEHQIEKAKKLAKKLGVNKLTFKTAQIYNFENGSELIPTQKKYARYVEKEKGVFVRKKKIHNRCWRAFSGTVISVDGEVLPCSFDKNADFSFGNLKNKPLAEIWHSEKALAFRRLLLTDRKGVGICCNCTE